MGIGPGPGPVAQFQVNPIIEVRGRNASTLSRQDLEYTLYGAGYNTSDLTSLLRIDSGFKEIGNELLYEISNIDICSTYGNKFTDIFDKPVEITKIGKSAFKHTFCTSNLDFSGWDQLTTIDDEAFSNDIGPIYSQISEGAIGLIPSLALLIFNNLNEGEIPIFDIFNSIVNGESVGVSKQRFDYRLGSINFSNTPSLQSIGQQAFCYGGISGPLDFSGLSSLQEIGQGAFLFNSLFYNGYYNPVTASFDIDTSFTTSNFNITRINFNNCPSLQTIGEGAFFAAGLNGLINFENLPSLTDICNFAFGSNLVFDISVGEPDYSYPNTISFTNCPNLQTIGQGAFGNSNISGPLDLSELTSLTTINAGAFQGNQITSLELSGNTSLTTISNEAFAGNNFINGIDFTNCISLNTIGEKAFYNSEISGVIDFSGLSSLTDICSQAFDGSQKITQFTFFDNSNCKIGPSVYPGLSGEYSVCPIVDLSLQWLDAGFTITNSAEQVWTI